MACRWSSCRRSSSKATISSSKPITPSRKGFCSTVWPGRNSGSSSPCATKPALLPGGEDLLEARHEQGMARRVGDGHGVADAEIALGHLGRGEQLLAGALERDAAPFDDIGAVGDGEAE